MLPMVDRIPDTHTHTQVYQHVYMQIALSSRSNSSIAEELLSSWKLGTCAADTAQLYQHVYM